jgi:hypothetical protein
MTHEIHHALSERERIRLAERALSETLARIQRWQSDNSTGTRPPSAEFDRAIQTIRNTLQEIA